MFNIIVMGVINITPAIAELINGLNTAKYPAAMIATIK